MRQHDKDAFFTTYRITLPLWNGHMFSISKDKCLRYALSYIKVLQITSTAYLYPPQWHGRLLHMKYVYLRGNMHYHVTIIKEKMLQRKYKNLPRKSIEHILGIVVEESNLARDA